MKREFVPVVLTTKEELLQALKKGDIKSSKYNLLSEDHKLFVELIVFGGYSAREAVKVIRPKAKSFKGTAERWAALENVADALEELSRAKDKKFMAEISSARDMALQKLQFIMTTTEDASLAAVCAKTILDKAEKSIENNRDKSATATETIKFALEFAKEVHSLSKEDVKEDEPIIIYEEPIRKDPDDKGLIYEMNYAGVDNYHAKNIDNVDE